MKRFFTLFMQRTGSSGPSGQTGTPDRPSDAEIDQLVASSFRSVHRTSPDTPRQWSRLESSLRDGPAAVRIRPAPRVRFTFAGAAVGGLALACAVFLVITFLPTMFPPGAAAVGHFTTARGEQSVITLPDSSEVVLNHTSSLDFDPAGFAGARSVTLAGEALFHVRANGAPFVVTTGAGRVIVTGTTFNVRVREDRYEIGVTEGSVRAVVRSPGNDTSFSVSAGQALAGRTGAPPLPIRPIEYDGYPGWNERLLLFTSMDLRSVCDELMDYFDVRITLENPAHGDVDISGAFDARDVVNVIATICTLTDLQYRYAEGTYILY